MESKSSASVELVLEAVSVDGKPLSYAQNMEDFHLWLALRMKESGTYVDIGGGHPIAGSVSFWFYERGWSGLVVEPQEDLASLHRRVRPRDTLVRAVIGRPTQEVEFYRVNRLHALSTTVKRHAQAAAQCGADFETIRLPSLSLAELFTNNRLDEIDFLKIDVEGAEAEVLLSGDWHRFRPKIVVAEAITPLSGEPAWHEWEPFLLAQGYRFALFDTLNRFYVAEEHPELLAQIGGERASWNSVVHMYEIGNAPDNPKHPDHKLAQDLAHGFWASLPQLDDELLRYLLCRNTALSATQCDAGNYIVSSDKFRAALGRIASKYDGGYIGKD